MPAALQAPTQLGAGAQNAAQHDVVFPYPLRDYALSVPIRAELKQGLDLNY
jgi:hypothetical protein